MFKKIISPVQAWLLSQRKCVGCGFPLSRSQKAERSDKTLKVICKCGRIFIFDPIKKTYRRALFEEV